MLSCGFSIGEPLVKGWLIYGKCTDTTIGCQASNLDIIVSRPYAIPMAINTKPERFEIRCTAQQLEHWNKAAAHDDRADSLAQWVRHHLDRAAKPKAER